MVRDHDRSIVGTLHPLKLLLYEAPIRPVPFHAVASGGVSAPVLNRAIEVEHVVAHPEVCHGLVCLPSKLEIGPQLCPGAGFTKSRTVKSVIPQTH